MKYLITQTSEEFKSKNAELEAILGLPSGPHTSYAEDLLQANNPVHADFEKYIFPVVEDGQWKCDQHFEPSELTEFDPDWFLPVSEVPL